VLASRLATRQLDDENESTRQKLEEDNKEENDDSLVEETGRRSHNVKQQ
jgi:hypothetical protein